MELQELQREVQPHSEAAQALLKAAAEPITTTVAFEGAAATLKTIKGKYNALDDREKAITKPINDGLKAIRDLFRGPKDVLQQAESALKRGMGTYQAEQERIAREAQRKAEAEAEAERVRLARLEAKAAERGDTAKAEQFQERAAAVVAPLVQVEKPKVAGIAMKDVWKFEITDPAQVPREYLVVDESRIRKVVQAMKSDTKIPGVRVYSEKQVSSSAA